MPKVALCLALPCGHSLPTPHPSAPPAPRLVSGAFGARPALPPTATPGSAYVDNDDDDDDDDIYHKPQILTGRFQVEESCRSRRRSDARTDDARTQT